MEGSPGTRGRGSSWVPQPIWCMLLAPIPTLKKAVHPGHRQGPHLPGTREEPGVSASLPRAGDEWLVYLLLSLSVPGRQRPGRGHWERGRGQGRAGSPVYLMPLLPSSPSSLSDLWSSRTSRPTPHFNINLHLKLLPPLLVLIFLKSPVLEAAGYLKAVEVFENAGAEHSYAVGGNVNWCNHYGEQYGGSSKSWS